MTWQTEHWEWDGDDKYQPEKANVDLIPNSSGSLGNGDHNWDSAYVTTLITSGDVNAGGDVYGRNLIVSDVGGITLTISGAAEITGPIGGASLDIAGTGNIGDDLTVSGKVAISGNVEIEGNGNALKLYYGEHFVGLKAPYLIASSTYTLPSAVGTTGQVLSLTGTPGELAWINPAIGDVRGPESATDNVVARFNSTTGKVIKNSVVAITDAGDISGAQNITASGNIEVTGNGNALKLYYGTYSVGLMAPSSLNANSGYTLPATLGQIGQVLAIEAISAQSIGGLGWVDAATGDVTGPCSATNNAVARFDSTTGKAIKNSVITITDVGDISGARNISAGGTLDITGRTDLRGVVEVHNNIAFDGQVNTFGLVTINQGLYMASAVTGYLYPAVSGGGGLGTSEARWGDTYLSDIDVDGDASFQASVNSDGFKISTTNFGHLFNINGTTEIMRLGADSDSVTSRGRIYATQDDDEAELAVLHLNQTDTDQPYFVFTGGTVYTGKTAEDEYLMVLKGSSVRYIRLYS